LVLGCSSTPIDVGSYAADDEERWGWTDEKACAAGAQLPIVGTWVGSVEAPTTLTRSTNAKLIITAANGRRVCGTLTLGNEAPPWPPVSNPDAAYPPELANALQNSFGGYLALLQGVPQTINASRVGLPRLAFRASYAQWRQWCAMQTPYLCEGIATTEYYCIPVEGSGGLSPRVTYKPGVGCVTGHSGEIRVIDCGKAALCLGGPCSCSAIECVAPPLWGDNYELEFSGDTAVGSGMRLTRVR
jgi:hypothetical protein